MRRDGIDAMMPWCHGCILLLRFGIMLHFKELNSHSMEDICIYPIHRETLN